VNVSDRTIIGNIRTTFTALGIKAPADVARAFDEADRLAEGAARLTAEPGAVERTITAAILGDRDPMTDPDVQRALTMQALAGNVMLADTISGAAIERLRDACMAEHDTIVTAWAKVYDKESGTLTRAHQQIGDHDLTDTTPILAKGGDIADVWAEAQDAVRVLDTVLTGWVNLMQFMRVSLTPDHRPLKVAALTYEQLSSMSPKLTPWDAVRAGLTPSLPTLEQYRQRVTAIQRGQSQHEASQVPVDREREANKAWAAKVGAR